MNSQTVVAQILNRLTEAIGFVITSTLVFMAIWFVYWTVPDWLTHNALGCLWGLGIQVEPSWLVHVLGFAVWFGGLFALFDLAFGENEDVRAVFS